MLELHCEYCQCPKDIWEKALITYDGDECKLYDSFLDLVNSDFPNDLTPQQVTDIAKRELPKEFSDITDIDATVKELVDIVINCGVIKEA